MWQVSFKENGGGLLCLGWCCSVSMKGSSLSLLKSADKMTDWVSLTIRSGSTHGVLNTAFFYTLLVPSGWFIRLPLMQLHLATPPPKMDLKREALQREDPMVRTPVNLSLQARVLANQRLSWWLQATQLTYAVGINLTSPWTHITIKVQMVLGRSEGWARVMDLPESCNSVGMWWSGQWAIGLQGPCIWPARSGDWGAAVTQDWSAWTLLSCNPSKETSSKTLEGLLFSLLSTGQRCWWHNLGQPPCPVVYGCPSSPGFSFFFSKKEKQQVVDEDFLNNLSGCELIRLWAISGWWTGAHLFGYVAPARLVYSVVEFGGSSGGGQAAVGQDLLFKCGVVPCNGIVDLLSLHWGRASFLTLSGASLFWLLPS